MSWLITRTPSKAERVADDVREQLFGEPEGWQVRVGEDRWLRRYLDSLADPGCVYVEVPVGGAAGGTIRRIDAVRLSPLAAQVRNYAPSGFEADLAKAREIEIIEVKRTLNRPVVGQLLVARDRAWQDWSLSPDRRLSLLALVTVTDLAIERFCMRNGIRVKIVDHLPEDTETDEAW